MRFRLCIKSMVFMGFLLSDVGGEVVAQHFTMRWCFRLLRFATAARLLRWRDFVVPPLVTTFQLHFIFLRPLCIRSRVSI